MLYYYQLILSWVEEAEVIMTTVIILNQTITASFVSFFYAEMTPPRAITMTTTVTLAPTVQITPHLTKSPTPGTHFKCRVV